MCGMEGNTLAKDFHKLMKSIASFSNKQAEVCHYEENLESFKVEIVPNNGLYCGGKFDFQVTLQNYPKDAPNVTCVTQIYHPNIDENGEICLNLFNEWVETNNLEDCVQGLLFLLYNPNLEDPLSPLFDPEQDNDYDTFAQNVRQSLEGGVVEGLSFERNLVEEDKSTGIRDESALFQKEDEAKQANEHDSLVGDVPCEVVDENADESTTEGANSTRPPETEPVNKAMVSGMIDTAANKDTDTFDSGEKLKETLVINEREVIVTTEPNPIAFVGAIRTANPELKTALVTGNTETNEDTTAISNSFEMWDETVVDFLSGKTHPYRTEDIVGCPLL